MTIGPAPRINTEWRSVRLGIVSVLPHQRDETVEKMDDVMWSRARLGMALESERGSIGALDTLQRPVEQRHVRRLETVRQRLFIDRKAVVLARDQHTIRRDFLHRMVRAVMAGAHLHSLRGARA